ncbi:NIF3 1 [Bradyrhizobium sp. STM 3843]|uniref:NIF3 1 n=1 Tax=Bradyrhizobium sp. STM 3843 TaxID=551947 RepID=UPI00055AA2BF|nr:NIF3 1 [Bradyrhizobium sp. STM 3843]
MKVYKIVVYVPEAQGDAVRAAMGAAGAGWIGNYDYCSFTVKGIGRFRPLAGANPTIGAVGRLEAVEEERIETVCAKDRLRDALQAIRTAHPYEEPAIDVYPIEVIE